MAKRIVWSANALADRISILSYWYERIGTKTYSIKLDKKLKESISQIKKFPEMGRVCGNEFERFVVKDEYLIFYEIKESEISILHIWDGRRNPDDFKLKN